jgi:hypothetical protein
VSEPQHRWATVSELQTEINRLRDTITYCERRILEHQQTMAAIVSLPDAGTEPLPPGPVLTGRPVVHPDRRRQRRSFSQEAVLNVFAGCNGDIVPLHHVLRKVEGFAQATVHLAVADLVRAGSLERVGRGQYRKLKVSYV